MFRLVVLKLERKFTLKEYISHEKLKVIFKIKTKIGQFATVPHSKRQFSLNKQVHSSQYAVKKPAGPLKINLNTMQAPDTHQSIFNTKSESRFR